MEKNNKEFSDKQNRFAKKEQKTLLKAKKIESKRIKKERQEKNKKNTNLSNDNNNEKHFWGKLKAYWPLSRVAGKIFLFYAAAVLIGGFLLSIPGVITKEGNGWDLLLGIFTASSAFSDTGIIMVSTNTDYSFWGQLIIVLLIQIGGIGILTIKISLFVFFGKKVSINDQTIAKTERGSSTIQGTVEMIKDAFIFLLFVELIGMVILFFAFYFHDPIQDPSLYEGELYTQDFGDAFWNAIFHSISATNNAGFSLFGDNSLEVYNKGSGLGYLIQSVFLLQWVIGGLGYPTYHDIKKKIKARRNGTVARFSLFTKLNFITYTTLFILGPLLVYISEVVSGVESLIIYTNDIKNSGGKIFMDILFNVSSSRNAGFSSVGINNFNPISKVIITTWMFIGSAPSSTAGGIRTTTFAICLIGIWSLMMNRENTNFSKKRIPDETVKKSFGVFTISIIYVFITTGIIILDNYHLLLDRGQFFGALLLNTSAFGTVGLSPLSNADMMQLGVITKLILIFTMFFGQLGIGNAFFTLLKPNDKKTHAYLKEDILIG